VYIDLGRLEEGRALLEAALTAYMAIYGPGHPAVTQRRLVLGRLLTSLGQLSDARAQLVEASAAVPRSDSRRSALVLAVRGEVEAEAGDVHSARGYLREATWVLSQRRRSTQWIDIGDELQFASAFLAAGEPAKAARHLQNALNAINESSTPTLRHRATVNLLLAKVATLQGAPGSARHYYEQALLIYDRDEAWRQHLNLASVLEGLVAVKVSDGGRAEAQTLLIQLLGQQLPELTRARLQQLLASVDRESLSLEDD
jgi:hypothetical protein